jgi:hypothetical protein
MAELLKDVQVLLEFAWGYYEADPSNKYYLGQIDALTNVVNLIKIFMGENKNG